MKIHPRLIEALCFFHASLMKMNCFPHEIKNDAVHMSGSVCISRQFSLLVRSRVAAVQVCLTQASHLKWLRIVRTVNKCLFEDPSENMRMC